MATSARGLVRNISSRDLKFQVLADELRRGILAGTWVAGGKLPTEAQLAAQSGLSLTTVRRAFDELVAANLVIRRQGAGTFVVGPPIERRRPRFRVGVLLPDTHLYFPLVLRGIEETLSAHGVSLQLASYNYRPECEDAGVELLLDAGVDGLILVPTLRGIADPYARAAHLMQLGVPAVLVERNLTMTGPADRTEHVCSDHAGGAYDAVTHLWSLGHKKVWLLTRTDTVTEPLVVDGYLQAARDFGFSPDIHSVTREDWRTGAANGLVRLLRKAGATAALVFGDREATILQGAARRSGLRVPQDLALVSYDDELADAAEVPLTAVAPAKHRMGRMAAEILLRRLREGDECPLHQVKLRPLIVVRDSCGAGLAAVRTAGPVAQRPG